MYKIYQVENNETLESIAQKLNTDVDTLKNINGIKGNVMLRPGSFLIVPMVDDRFQKYVVQCGDNLYYISQKYNTTVDSIKRKNNLTSNLLSIGQKLII